ncbi:hypothetical protein [Lysinibacillus xylanilyticus]|uniref:hypothetical protein n=1 Tax=Lysinibacillus xylanilyticus TaxID=582475 RepID=UPI003D005E44
MGISFRGTKAKTITSCDNAFVTNIRAAAASLALRLRTENICCPETLERSEAAATNVLSVRQLQSAQSERKSTTRFGNEQLRYS